MLESLRMPKFCCKTNIIIPQYKFIYIKNNTSVLFVHTIIAMGKSCNEYWEPDSLWNQNFSIYLQSRLNILIVYSQKKKLSPWICLELVYIIHQVQPPEISIFSMAHRIYAKITSILTYTCRSFFSCNLRMHYMISM